jgi:hypothetical protein
MALAGLVSSVQAQIHVNPSPITFRLPGASNVEQMQFGNAMAAQAQLGQAIAARYGAGGLGLGGFGYLGGSLGSPVYVPQYAPQAYSATPSYSYLIAPGLTNSSGYGNQGGSATLTTTPSSSSGSSDWAPVSSSYYPNYSVAGGYFQGVADLTTASGNFVMSMQRARLVQEEGTRSQIQTRRAVWEEAQWERMNTVFTEDYRASLIKNDQRRARLDPPLNEIWSGQTLNVLLNAAANERAKGVRGPDVPIPDDVLKHINLTVGTGNTGNIGLLKNDTLQWPLALQQGSEFAEMVKNLNQRIPDARQQARFDGKVAPGLLKDIRKDLQGLQDALLREISEMAPPDYIESKRFLNNLGEAVRALSDPNIQNYLTGKYAAKGRNVAELVENMTKVQGLQFAPATPGDEAAYRALYRALQAYDSGLNQLNTSLPAPMPTSGSGSGDK